MIGYDDRESVAVEVGCSISSIRAEPAFPSGSCSALDGRGDVVLCLDRSVAASIGARWLSGCSDGAVLCVHRDDGDGCWSVCAWDRRRSLACTALPQRPADWPPAAFVCLSGHAVSDERWVGEIARMFPQCRMYVCPLPRACGAVGVALAAAVANGLERQPRRAPLWSPHSVPVVGFSRKMDFAEGLADDCIGQLARSVASGCVTRNECFRGLGFDPFHWRLLSTKPLSGASALLVPPESVTRTARTMPVSLRYASRSVPVVWDGRRLAVVDGHVKATLFFRFLAAMGCARPVYSSSVDDEAENVVLVRYNAAYRQR